MIVKKLYDALNSRQLNGPNISKQFYTYLIKKKINERILFVRFSDLAMEHLKAVFIEIHEEKKKLNERMNKCD